MYALDASIIEKERNRNQAEVSVEQTTKVVDAWRKVSDEYSLLCFIALYCVKISLWS